MCSLKRTVPKNFAIFTEKTPLFDKVGGFWTSALLKRDSNTGAFPMNIAEVLKSTFKNICERLVLHIERQILRTQIGNTGY